MGFPGVFAGKLFFSESVNDGFPNTGRYWLQNA